MDKVYNALQTRPMIRSPKIPLKQYQAIAAVVENHCTNNDYEPN